jgi:putative ABC transport system ATP-binding protein
MNAGSREIIITAKDLTRVYPMGAVDVVGITDINLQIATGELVVLKGNSGSGKSTLLALLAGLDQPTAGSLIVAGHNLHEATPNQLIRYRREIVGVIFQSFNLLPTLTVLENISLPALLSGQPFDAVKAKARELMEWLNLRSRQDHRPAQLSGGEMQRTAIARSLINDPEIILADEPTGNLDSHNGEIVIQLLSELNRNSHRTVIVATHSTLADPYATSGFRLKDGVITQTICSP